MMSGSIEPSFRPSMPFLAAKRTHSRAVSGDCPRERSHPSPLNGR